MVVAVVAAVAEGMFENTLDVDVKLEPKDKENPCKIVPEKK